MATSKKSKGITTVHEALTKLPTEYAKVSGVTFAKQSSYTKRSNQAIREHGHSIMSLRCL